MPSITVENGTLHFFQKCTFQALPRCLGCAPIDLILLKPRSPRRHWHFCQMLSVLFCLLLVPEKILKMSFIHLCMLFAHGFCSSLEDLPFPCSIKDTGQCARPTKALHSPQAGSPLTATSFIGPKLEEIQRF